MKEATIDRQRAVVTHRQAPKVAQPGDGALNDPAPFVTPQRSAILRGRFAPTRTMRSDGFDTTSTQFFSQPIAIIATIHDHALGFLSWSPLFSPERNFHPETIHST